MKALLEILVGCGFSKVGVELLGYPPFRPSLYQFGGRKVPLYGYFWIVLDKLTTLGAFKCLKELVVFCSLKVYS